MREERRTGRREERKQKGIKTLQRTEKGNRKEKK